MNVRQRNVGLLLGAVLTVIVMALVPVVTVRVQDRMPELNDTARDLLPPELGKVRWLVVYGEPRRTATEWLAIADERLLELDTLFPKSLPPTPPGQEPLDTEVALFTDREVFVQTWTQIFGTQPDSARRGVGRGGFVLRLVEDELPPPPADRPAVLDPSPDLVATAEHLADAILEDQMPHRFPHLPEWYRGIVRGMVVQRLLPSSEAMFAERYRELRRSGGEAPTERGFIRDYDESATAELHRLTARLIGARFARSPDASAFIGLVDEGETYETTFRALATSSREPWIRAGAAAATTTTSGGTDALGEGPTIRSSYGGVLADIDAWYGPNTDDRDG